MWTDKSLAVIEDAEPYVANDGTTYPGQFPKAEIPGLTKITEVLRPDEAPSIYTLDGQPRGGIEIVTINGREWRVEMQDGAAIQVWHTVPRPELTPAEAQAVAERDLVVNAQMALDASDRTALRCFESGLPLPSEWATYRSVLRSIVAGGSGPIPERPAWPPGT